MTTPDQFRLRPFQPGDEDALYEVCLKTGDSGSDASQLYKDPMALGQLYVGPYVALEPELAFVLEDVLEGHSGVCGYVLGALDTEKFQRVFKERWLPPLQATLPDPSGDPAKWNHDERIYHELHHPRLEFSPPLAPYPSHLHIDLLARAQGRGWGRRMIETLLDALRARGSRGVHLGVGLANTRAQGFYRKLDFQELFRVNADGSGAIFMGRFL
ncbi:MAG TPA: N-acetyltransferase [Trueperaceae bacterium]|nr:N-acetyltransferase [Trueperaceae bacterium]